MPKITVGAFPKWSRNFIDFREDDETLAHELRSMLAVTWSQCGKTLGCYTRDW